VTITLAPATLTGLEQHPNQNRIGAKQMFAKRFTEAVKQVCQITEDMTEAHIILLVERLEGESVESFRMRVLKVMLESPYES